MERFDLEDAAQSRMAEFGVRTPVDVVLLLSYDGYEAMLLDPESLRRLQIPHNVALVHGAEQLDCRLGLATMSTRSQTMCVLRALNLVEAFEVVVTCDDVERGKPDPQVFQLAAQELGIPPRECLAIEDSLGGVVSALGAGMWCVAVPGSSVSRQKLHRAGVLDKRWIVDGSRALTDVVHRMLAERRDD